MLYSKLSLVTNFLHSINSTYMSIPNSQFLPTLPLQNILFKTKKSSLFNSSFPKTVTHISLCSRDPSLQTNSVQFSRSVVSDSLISIAKISHKSFSHCVVTSYLRFNNAVNFFPSVKELRLIKILSPRLRSTKSLAQDLTEWGFNKCYQKTKLIN